MSTIIITLDTQQFPNGSDHAVIACYLELYKEGEVEHINGVWPSFSNSTALGRTKNFSGYTWHQSVRTCTSPYKYRTRYRIFDL